VTPFTFSITRAELYSLEDKMMRGSNGGKQMAKLSSKESKFILGLLSLCKEDYPDWFESILSDTKSGIANAKLLK
jgi:hypothetical protein